jgi:hypothetical protein
MHVILTGIICFSLLMEWRGLFCLVFFFFFKIKKGGEGCVTPGYYDDSLKNYLVLEKEQISDILFF